MTENKRCSVMITPDLEEALRKMRKTDEYCMLSLSEIIRQLVQRGLAELEAETTDAQG